MPEYSARMPDFLIVGAPRCGTTSLYNYLKVHPDIFMPEQKELYFLATYKRPEYIPRHAQPITSLGDYRAQFASARPDQKIGEATPLYLSMHDEVIASIKAYIPQWRDLKIIIILRNPVERAFSSYLQQRRAGIEKRDFINAIQPSSHYIQQGLYYAQVKAYLDTFPSVKIFLYEDVVHNPKKVVQELYSFVGVDARFIPPNINQVFNEGKTVYRWQRLTTFGQKPNAVWSILARLLVFVIPKDMLSRIWIFLKSYVKKLNHKPMNITFKDRQVLKPYFVDDITMLERSIKRDVSAWYT